MTKVTLQFKPEALNFLRNTLDNHLKTLAMVGINPLIKKELVNDVSKVKITLRNAEQQKEQ